MSQRYEALDSWRGVAALMVAVFHLNSLRPITTAGFVTNGWLFVDFFFVLSGFVIAANYQHKLLAGFGIGRFMLLRFGRLYPLHLAVLLVYIASRAVRWRAGDPTAFAAPTESMDTILVNLALLQSMHVYDFLTWNYPSWSISAEFYAYLLFAGLVLISGRRVWLAASGLAALCCAFVLGLNGNLNTSNELGLLRCLFGFCLGAVTWRLHQLHAQRLVSGTMVELIALAAVMAFISVVGLSAWSVAAPVVFAAAVFVFAQERGAVSRVLRARPLQVLGTLSYSIYMVHAFTAGAVKLLDGVVSRLAPRLHDALFVGVPLYVGYLAIVVAVSWVTYTLIEEPARDWSQRLAKRMAPREFVSAPSATA